MKLIRVISCWLFPFQEEAERKSTQAVLELEKTIAEIREIRKESLEFHHLPLTEQDVKNELNASN